VPERESSIINAHGTASSDPSVRQLLRDVLDKLSALDGKVSALDGKVSTLHETMRSDMSERFKLPAQRAVLRDTYVIGSPFVVACQVSSDESMLRVAAPDAIGACMGAPKLGVWVSTATCVPVQHQDTLFGVPHAPDLPGMATTFHGPVASYLLRNSSSYDLCVEVGQGSEQQAEVYRRVRDVKCNSKLGQAYELFWDACLLVMEEQAYTRAGQPVAWPRHICASPLPLMLSREQQVAVTGVSALDGSIRPMTPAVGGISHVGESGLIMHTARTPHGSSGGPLLAVVNPDSGALGAVGLNIGDNGVTSFALSLQSYMAMRMVGVKDLASADWRIAASSESGWQVCRTVLSMEHRSLAMGLSTEALRGGHGTIAVARGNMSAVSLH